MSSKIERRGTEGRLELGRTMMPVVMHGPFWIGSYHVHPGTESHLVAASTTTMMAVVRLSDRGGH